jgi:hypothetical protein
MGLLPSVRDIASFDGMKCQQVTCPTVPSLAGFEEYTRPVSACHLVGSLEGGVAVLMSYRLDLFYHFSRYLSIIKTLGMWDSYVHVTKRGALYAMQRSQLPRAMYQAMISGP